MRCFAADDNIADPKVQADLIAAIAADEVGESTWLEWKSSLNFDAKQDLGIIAKGMVAMANRLPGSSEPFGGKGILVIGAAAGSVQGVGRIDPAVLSDKLDPYVGEDLKHDWFWCEFNGKWVLIITVAAPQPGDRIHTIHKEFPAGEPKMRTPTVRDGTIYVRRSAKSQPATSADMGRLMDRLTATRLKLDVTVSDGQVSSFIVEPGADELADQIVDEERHGRLKQLYGLKGNVRWGSARCTPDEYRDEVEHYCAELGPRVLEYFNAMASYHSPPFTLKVANLTDENFTAVEIVLELPVAIRAAVQTSSDALPHFQDVFAGRPPAVRPSGVWPEVIAMASGTPAVEHASHALGSNHEPKPAISQDMERTKITFRPFNLRPDTTVFVEQDVALFAYAPLPEMVECHWYATATSTNGRAEGSLAITVGVNENDLAAEARHWLSEQPYRHER